MPLLDHFPPPLSQRRQWHSFHSVWASMIALDLNRQLPPGYFADPNVEFNIDLHAELVKRVTGVMAPASELWAAAYRPWQTGGQTSLQIWHHALALGAGLPTLPFWLKNGPCIRLDLDETYMRTLQEQRMLTAGEA